MLTAAFIYGGDELNVSIPPAPADQEACIARGDTGAWVKAWVYVPYDTVNEDKPT